MILVNTDYINGKELEMISMVEGSTVRAKHIGKDLFNGLKHMVGGELTSYSQMMNEAREIATERMIAEAKKLNADAIINIRYTTSAIVDGAAEILVYGTAVKFK